MTRDQSSKHIHWHTAFYEAIQLELEDYKGVFEFKPEYQLTAEPLRIDTVIVKKIRDVVIRKNFAQIFRAENILEYKSPEDYLSVRDFYKVYSYACLYAASTPHVAITDITLTFVETRYPKELIKHLQEVRHYTVTEPWSGIHRVSGDFLPIQILESKKLSESDNIWLRGLNPGLDIRSTDIILRRSEQKEKGAPIGAYLEVFLRANSLTLKEAYNMAQKYPTLEEVLTDIGWVQKWTEQGLEQGQERSRQETARKMKAHGRPLNHIIEDTGLSPEEIERL
jgi:hypothetical protein